MSRAAGPRRRHEPAWNLLGVPESQPSPPQGFKRDSRGSLCDLTDDSFPSQLNYGLHGRSTRIERGEQMSDKPKRIQRKRTKGWKMPDGAVYVGRPTEWGNPFRVDSCESREVAVANYRRWIEARDADLRRTGKKFFDGPYSVTVRMSLRDKDLACWCPLDQPCHADVLLEIANKV